jgi:hypothetical protein
MTRHAFTRLALVLVLVSTGCTKVYNSPSSPSATPTPTHKLPDRIEFRVLGQQLSGPIAIRHTDPINGVTLYNGGVPYFAAVSSKQDSIFLFIEATGFGIFSTSGLQVQIFVNGQLFREAFTQGFSLSVQASGTYRPD